MSKLEAQLLVAGNGKRRGERSGNFRRPAADLEKLAQRLGEIPLEELRPYCAAAE